MSGKVQPATEWAAQLREARQNKGWSQERAAQEVGTSRRHWMRWESGLIAPNPLYLERIAEVLEDDSLTGDSDDDEEAAQVAPLTAEELEMFAYFMRRLATRGGARQKVA